MKYTVTSLKIIIVGLCVAVLMLLGCASDTRAAKVEGPRRTYTIKVYDYNSQLLFEQQTYSNPTSGYFSSDLGEHTSIRFKDTNGKQFTIVNGIIEVTED